MEDKINAGVSRLNRIDRGFRVGVKVLPNPKESIIWHRKYIQF